MNIYINADQRSVNHTHITYPEIVALAEESGTPTVTYHWRGAGDMSRNGTMYPGCNAVELADGMWFTCVHTGDA